MPVELSLLARHQVKWIGFTRKYQVVDEMVRGRLGKKGAYIIMARRHISSQSNYEYGKAVLPSTLL